MTYNMSVIFLCIAIIMTSLGQISFKMRHVKKNIIYLFFACVFFVLAPVCSYFALKHLSVSDVYMSTAFVHVIIMLFSLFFLKEKMESRKYIGLTLIVVGIIIYGI